MKKLFKWLFRLVLIFVILMALLLVFKDSILTVVARQALCAETGMGVKLGKLEFGLVSPVIVVENLKLYNTAEFGGSKFLDVPELYIEYDRAALFSRDLHARLLRLNLSEYNIVKSEAGGTNVVELVTRVNERIKAREARRKKKHARPFFEFSGIDTLNVSLGRMHYLDLARPANNAEKNLGLQNEVIKNIKSERDLSSAMLVILVKSGLISSDDLYAFMQDFLRDPAGAWQKTAHQLRGLFAVPAKKERTKN